MGRTRTKKQAAAKNVEPPASSPQVPPSIPALLQKAQSLIVQCDYELAQRFITRVLEQQPSHAEAKEMLGVAQLELGEIEAARAVGFLFDALHSLLNIIIDIHCAFAPASGCPVPAAALRPSVSCPAERRRPRVGVKALPGRHRDPDSPVKGQGARHRSAARRRGRAEEQHRQSTRRPGRDLDGSLV